MPCAQIHACHKMKSLSADSQTQVPGYEKITNGHRNSELSVQREAQMLEFQEGRHQWFGRGQHHLCNIILSIGLYE